MIYVLVAGICRLVRRGGEHSWRFKKGVFYHGTHRDRKEGILTEGLRAPVWLTQSILHARVYGPVIFEVRAGKLNKALLQGSGQVRIYHDLIPPEFLRLTREEEVKNGD